MPSLSRTVTVTSAFSNGAYDALSNASFTDAADALETVTVTSFDVAVARATVEASIT